MVDVDRFGECWDEITPQRRGEEVDLDGVEVLHVLRHEQPGHHLVHEGEGQVPENERHNQHQHVVSRLLKTNCGNVNCRVSNVGKVSEKYQNCKKGSQHSLSSA